MRRPLLRRFPVPALLALLATAACAHVAPSGDSMSSQVILTDEIQRSRAVTAYDAIAKLRHNFLSDRGRTSNTSRLRSHASHARCTTTTIPVERVPVASAPHRPARKSCLR